MKNEFMERASIVGMIEFVPLVMMVNFLYNDLIAIALAFFAIYYQLKFLKNKNIKEFVLSSAGISIALIFRSNVVFILIGMLFLYIYKIFEHKTRIRFAILLVAVVIVMQGVLHFSIGLKYNYREGLSESPMYWIAMSLQDEESLGGDLSYSQPGIWNAYSTKAFKEFQSKSVDRDRSDYNDPDNKTEVTNIYKKDILSRLVQFKNDPIKMIKFFTKRVAATWTDASFTTEKNNKILSDAQKTFIENNFSAYTTFSGIHPSKVDNIGTDPANMQSAVHKSLTNGKANWIVQNYINKPFMIMTIFAAIMGLLILRKKITPEILMLLLTFLGGFMFHEFLWEARSRYIIFEFIILIPIASYSIYKAYHRLDLLLKNSNFYGNIYTCMKNIIVQ